MLGLELRAPGNQLRGCDTGERDAKIDFASQGQRLEEASLCLHFIKGSSDRYILPQLKFQDARRRWWGTCDPGLPLPPTIQGLARTTASPLNLGLLTAGETAVKRESAAGLWP